MRRPSYIPVIWAHALRICTDCNILLYIRIKMFVWRCVISLLTGHSLSAMLDSPSYADNSRLLRISDVEVSTLETSVFLRPLLDLGLDLNIIVKGCLYYDTRTAYMCAAHVRRTCAMNVYTMIHVRRTPVRRTCTAYMYHSVNTL